MKRTCILALTAATLLIQPPIASALTLGPYVGLGAGLGKVKTPEEYAFVVNTIPGGSTRRDLSGLAGRAFIGYNLYKWLSLEAGYTRYSKALYVGRAPGLYASYSYYFKTYDAVLKGHLPLGDFFTMYGLAGVSRIAELLSYVNNGVPLSGALPAPPTANTRVYRTRPVYGFGFTYNFAKRLTLSIEATEVQRIGSMSGSLNATPALDFFSLNLAYSFC